MDVVSVAIVLDVLVMTSGKGAVSAADAVVTAEYFLTYLWCWSSCVGTIGVIVR